MNFRQKECMN